MVYSYYCCFLKRLLQSYEILFILQIHHILFKQLPEIIAGFFFYSGIFTNSFFFRLYLKLSDLWLRLTL